jgi:hypothetical protein
MWAASVGASPCVTKPRIIRMASPNPLVVTSAVFAPARVMSVLSPIVQAWKKNLADRISSSSSRKPMLWAASRTASMAPIEKSSGVDKAFPNETPPSSSTTTQSVKVPPMSTPRT